MTNGTKVQKRDGRIESLDLDKMHLMVEEACDGLAGVSASQVEIQSGIQFYDGITTGEIQEILIKSASDLIDLDHVNYQFVAARLLLFAVRKRLYGKTRDLPNLEQHIYNCTNIDVYDKDIFTKYSKEEIEKANSYIDHTRDFLFTYAGLRQVVDKYLVQDRSGGGVYETPQFMYIMIALTIFAEYPKEKRLNYVRRYYDAISRHKLNIPTPIMAGVRTPLRQFASCVLVDIDDTLDSIFLPFILSPFHMLLLLQPPTRIICSCSTIAASHSFLHFRLPFRFFCTCSLHGLRYMIRWCSSFLVFQ